ncbi:hypothetical protein BU23DRAFT_573078 [Bimuria novae-zelandiae CBS 107.79]|uniref:Rhodopsin domain-containing protein n=1 Tax=Bimuria novae-zelandiae CBS 107.79 TaxID=1447943 RepID=A0A6A5UV13_9PLEO|nr:hypothetical protein BU23DRAFT_573078 [Bimuria novae-zelandiae CBS 107.79]
MNNTSTWNLDDTAGRASQPLLNICIIFAILETLFVIAFVFSWHYNRGNNSNNTKGVYVLILLGYLFCFGGVIMGILKLTLGGAGRHVHTLRPQTVQRMLKLIKAHEFVYVLSVPFPKLAMLCLYFRLFNGKLAKFILYATGLVIVGTSTFGVIGAFTNCRPFVRFWDTTHPAHCTMDPMTAMRFYSAPNIATDAALLLIPLPALFKLNGDLWRKIGVGLTFLVSTVGIVTAVLRFVVFLRTDVFLDVTYYSVVTTNWSIIEPGVHLMGATVPTLRPLIRRLFSQLPRPISTMKSATQPATAHSPSMPKTPKTPVVERPALIKKSSARDMVPTIGRAPSRQVRLDDYHYMQWGSGVHSLRSDDEESMVCADAIVHETMGRQGRNPDGTLQLWSLQPVQYSPLRTSFFFESGSPR